jgi:hypothetical protein
MADKSAQEVGEMAFMARAMVQATLPHRKVAGNEFIRRNGNYTLTLLAPTDPGLPYGAIPRLVLAWLTTEAVRTKQRELDLGHSMSMFMAEIGMSRQGNNITRLKDQTRRLFSSTVTAISGDRNKTVILNRTISDKSEFWWDPKDPDQVVLWNSTVTLAEQFFREITEHPIPVDMRAIKELKKSSLALDIYFTLTHRASYLTKPSTISWQSLSGQFGSDYTEPRDFKKNFILALKKVTTVYPGVWIDVTDAGLTIKPSLTHVPLKAD